MTVSRQASATSIRPGDTKSHEHPDLGPRGNKGGRECRQSQLKTFLTLPRVASPDPVGAHDRPVKAVNTAPSGFEGEGFPVRRAFAGATTADLDPFIHMDQMGEVNYAPGEPKGTPWHPHRGFETVTYIIDGTFDHQDSNGGGGRITNGDTQWMTAGAGILHIEAPPEQLVVTGGLFHGIQLWVNLPSANKWNPPQYQDIRGRESALLTTGDGGALLRVIAGDLDGHAGPGSTFTPITLVHATVSPGAEVRSPGARTSTLLLTCSPAEAAPESSAGRSRWASSSSTGRVTPSRSQPTRPRPQVLIWRCCYSGDSRSVSPLSTTDRS